MSCDLKEKIDAFLCQKIKFFHDASFDDPKKQKLILREIPNKQEYEKKILNSKSLNYSDSLSYYREYPVLTPEQEFHMFRKMSYLKYRANKRSEALLHLYEKNKWMCEKRLKECMDLISRSIEIRNFLASSNLRLAFSIAKKIYFEDIAIADAYYAIFKSVDKFNWTLGFKFSTYATMAVRNELINLRNEVYELNSKQVKYDFTSTPEKDCGDKYYVSNDIAKKELLQKLIEKFEIFVNERNKTRPNKLKIDTYKYIKILKSYYGLGQQPKTAIEISKEINTNRKRVHQILHKAISTIKEICLTDNIKEDYLV